jgi:geranylgeranyl diphosphate synthase type II
MEKSDRVEKKLIATLEEATGGGPGKLSEAMCYALFPGGGRVRPRLVLEVAEACGDPEPGLTDAFAAALELVHCASLVHDDLPAFDDSPTRRGKPTVHKVFGDGIAVLVGDALIVHAFELLGAAGADHPVRAAALTRVLGEAVGASRGIIAGQAWESEDAVDVEEYHRAKTAALFEAAAMGGAISAGQEGEPWRELGRYIGRAYQVADDIADAMGDEEALGKPVGQDRANDRPSLVATLGPIGAMRRLDSLLLAAMQSIPGHGEHARLNQTLFDLAMRLCPPETRERCIREGKHDSRYWPGEPGAEEQRARS